MHEQRCSKSTEEKGTDGGDITSPEGAGPEGSAAWRRGGGTHYAITHDMTRRDATQATYVVEFSGS